WNVLGHLRDPRLVRFSLASNRGPYFAHAVALLATPDPFYLMQDADDWSHPERLSILLDDIETEQAHASFSDVTMHHLRSTGRTVPSRLRWYSVVDFDLGPRYLHRAPHHALFRAEALRRIGGYYGGYRIGFDTLIMNLLLMTGKLSYVSLPLYNCTARPM